LCHLVEKNTICISETTKHIYLCSNYIQSNNTTDTDTDSNNTDGNDNSDNSDDEDVPEEVAGE